jgi:predicted nucleotidyltransferase
MVIGSHLDIDVDAVSAFCRRHRIRRLAVFGSVLRDDFGPESDVDLLVDFEPGSTPGLLRIAAMERALSNLFAGREVELRTMGDLSRYFRDEVRAEAVPVYDAAA